MGEKRSEWFVPVRRSLTFDRLAWILVVILLHALAAGNCPAQTSSPVQDGKLEDAERLRVVDGAIANVRKFYVDAEIGQKVADALLAHQRSGEDNDVTDGRTFADLLTRQMRDVSHDRHLVVAYSQEILPEHRAEPTPESNARYKKWLEENHCLFETVEVLPHAIGYLKLGGFPNPEFCGTTAIAAMATLNNADAIIFDLRENRGGDGQMGSLLAAYLFDHPEYWFSPRENTTEHSWTKSPVNGSKLADKPAYVLTSASTWSAAEQFCFDLKALKRATLVGETTGGGAHAGVFHRIDDHFGIGISEVKPINPYSENDWEGTGVDPDVKVKAEEALKEALKLAEARLAKK